MTVLECPACSHEMGEGESLEGACPTCGFAYPYARTFVSAISRQRWRELVVSHRDALVSDARVRLSRGRLLQATYTDVYLLDERTHVLSRGSAWGFSPVKEGVMRFSTAKNDLVAVMEDGSLWSSSGFWAGAAGTAYRDVELTSTCLYALRSDGSVEVSGECAFKSEIEGWSDVEELAAGECHVAARLADGSVRFAASPIFGLDVFRRPCEWRGIVSLSSSADCTVGVDGDGCVLLAGREGDGREEARQWEDVAGVVAEGSYVVGIDGSGKVLVATSVELELDNGRTDAAGWEDVVALTCGRSSVIGVMADGALKVAGAMPMGSSIVRSWDAAAVRRMIFSAV